MPVYEDGVNPNSISAHTAGADPHTGYRLESADHTHASTGLQAGTLDHGAAITGLTDDDHTQYLKEKASGGTAAETPTHTHSGASEAGTVSHADLTALTTGDPHTQYRLESEDHTHATTGAQGGTISHANLTSLTTGDPHTQYRLESEDHNHQSTGAQGGVLALAALPTIAQYGAGSAGADRTTTSGSFTDVTNCSVTLTTDGGPCLVLFTGPVNGGGVAIQMTFSQDAVDNNILLSSAFNGNIPGMYACVYQPSAGSHTWKARFRSSDGATTVAVNGSSVAIATLYVFEFKK